VDIGIGLPNTIDRIVFDNYDPFVALAAAAAVTERIRLATAILIVPYRVNAAVVAKQAASLQALSSGRLVLGAAIGARDDDYEASGLTTDDRGDKFDAMLEEMKRIWAGEERGYAGAIGPLTDDPPQLIVGGSVAASFRRAARFGDGWMMGGGAPDQFAEAATKVREAWSKAGRDGEPRLMALAYFSLGPDAEQNARDSIGTYYQWLGEYGDQIVSSAAKDPETVQQYVSAFEQAGCDELVFFPASGDPEQASLLAEALGR
jgi:alkanesulfonate monooxygenase SsuD/methylene tetrahydromethanopterin reductase-like flavin-dependent oxidoreductase (luciferase family)